MSIFSLKPLLALETFEAWRLAWPSSHVLTLAAKRREQRLQTIMKPRQFEVQTPFSLNTQKCNLNCRFDTESTRHIPENGGSVRTALENMQPITRTRIDLPRDKQAMAEHEVT